MSSSTSQQQSQSQTSPWQPQASALTSAFNNANAAYGQASQAVAPTNYVSQFTPDQLSTFHNMLGYANGNTLPTTQGNAGATNVNNGTNASAGALTGLQNFNPSTATSAPSLINTATQYMHGQNIPAEVQAAMLSGEQTARNVTLPGVVQNAAIGGNADSSRNGIAQGLVEQGLAEQAGALSGQLGSQAFQNGLTLASNNANTTNAAELQALQNWGVLGNSTTNAGTNLGNSSVNNAGSLYGIAENAGQGEQAAAQAALDNQLKQYQAQVSDPYAPLNGLMGIIGSNNWGSNSSGTSTTTTTPSAFSVIGGLLGGAGSLASGFGDLGWQPFGKSA
jgi:hypothetical protein